ncbi:MAG: HIT domain-containing protein, partial [Planctomycetota bacterium]
MNEAMDEQAHAAADERDRRLWAPWRMSYIKDPKRTAPRPAEPTCFLCDYAADPAGDVDNRVILRSGTVFAVLNRFPYNNGHVLVAPLAHKASVVDLDDEELLDSMRVIRRLVSVMTTMLNAAGFNVGLNLGSVAGAGVPGHLHWHIVPRWPGDSNFMDVVGETHVIP